MKTIFKYLLSAQLLVMSPLVFSQIPETQRSEGIAYITGGVGEGESVAILAEAKQWPLFLELSQLENGRGVWIFGANIKISNASQKIIFDAQAEGPYMLVNLDAGDYVINASYQGVTQTKATSIKSGSTQKLSLFWK
jgi:predicted RNA-binding protein YlxR (DUF448 family)